MGYHLKPVFLLILFGFGSFAESGDGKKVCKKASCRELAEITNGQLNTSVDPCENFGDYNCGTFYKNAVVPADKLTTGGTFDLPVFFYRNILDLLRGKRNRDIPSLKLAQTYYQSCMDQASIDKLGLDPFLDKIIAVGGWPVVTNWNESNYTWDNQVKYLIENGFNDASLVPMEAVISPEETITIKLKHPELGLPLKSLTEGLDNKDVKETLQYMKEAVQLFDANDVEEDIKKVMEFMISLAGIYDERKYTEYFAFSTLNLMNLKAFPNGVKVFLNSALGTKFKDDDKIAVVDVQYLLSLGNLINKTPKRTIANFIGWQIFRQNVDYLNSDAINLSQKYTKSINSDKSQNCLKLMGLKDDESNIISLIVASAYLDRYFDKKAEKEFNGITAEMKKTLLSDIKTSKSWQNLKRDESYKKIQEQNVIVKFPPQLRDLKEIKSISRGLKIKKNTFLQNHLNVESQTLKTQLSQKSAIASNSYFKVHKHGIIYDKESNNVVVYLFSLVGFFFNEDFPGYVNYANLGVAVLDYMMRAINDNFEQDQQQCFAQQYGDFVIRGLGIKQNGQKISKVAMGENKALYLGLKAYSEHLKNDGDDMLLPGQENWNSLQSFAVYATRILCVNLNAKISSLVPFFDFPLPSLIMKGWFQNNNKIREAFNCKVSSGACAV